MTLWDNHYKQMADQGLWRDAPRPVLNGPWAPKNRLERPAPENIPKFDDAVVAKIALADLIESDRYSFPKGAQWTDAAWKNILPALWDWSDTRSRPAPKLGVAAATREIAEAFQLADDGHTNMEIRRYIKATTRLTIDLRREPTWT